VTTVIPIEDYGIDLYCTLTKNDGLRSVVTDYYSVQIKSSADPWVFDTVEKIKWLLDYSTPLFLGCVDSTKTVLSIYQTMPRYLAGFSEPGARLTLEPSEEDDGKFAQWSDGERFSLSAPIIRVSLAELSEPDRLESLRKVFQYWVRLDSYNSDLRRMGILRLRMPDKYRVNEGAVAEALIEQGRLQLSPAQLKRALQTLVEVVDCVGNQLRVTGDRERALYAALLLRHLFSVRQEELASDPRWSMGVSPSVVSQATRELNRELMEAGTSPDLFEGLDQTADLVRGLPLVAKYLAAVDAA